ncbi:MAG: lysophospholipid acyltransferase family protein [Gammaproteobacteria bacterium]|nr:lysophospholipid acyltransferase family protein [Gammaproteobacteria bacterium]MCB1925405.1 lysophospholipid acyltransferase family protein [Gammaproteobacteria bacterium]
MRDVMAKALFALLRVLPFGAAGALGAFAGRLMSLGGGRSLHNARVNLALCFPEKTADERERLARRNLVETGRALAQMLKIWLTDDHDWAKHVEGQSFMRLGRELVDRGKGMIIALPHLGNWEVIAYVITRIAPTTALYRPPRLAALDPVMRAGRARPGVQPVPIDRQGLKEIHAALKRGEIIVILPDQVPKTAGASGVVAPFFGHPAMTMTLIGRLAHRHGSPVLFAYALPDGGQQFRIHCFEGDAAIGDASPEVAAAALNRDVERCVRAAPAFYQWSYRRFSIPGEREHNPYARASDD